MCIDEPNGKPHLNLIKKFEHEPNLIIVKPEPCDLGWDTSLIPRL